MKNITPAIFVSALLSIVSATGTEAAQTKCVANFPDGGKGTLILSDGKPVSYSTNSGYVASDTSLSGSTIRIDAATYRLTQKTDKILKGRWSLRGRTFDVTFRCK